MKLIDKDALTEKLWERRVKNRDFGGSPYSEYGHEDDEILSLIDTLEVKEVDLNAEIIKWEESFKYRPASMGYKETAKHFFELGLNTQRSSINIPNIDDILEESGIDPYSKEAKIFKESYYMVLEKLKEQKGEEL